MPIYSETSLWEKQCFLYRFHKIAWGCYGFGREYGNGIIVGGCDGGRIQVYNAAKVLAGEEGLVAHPDKHAGPVRALDFNPYQVNTKYVWFINC
jgi:protein transport protein SEC31